MALIGYARVSSVGQSLDVQLDKLQHCDKVYQEKKSGTIQQRFQLDACLEYVREEDTLVVSRLDRLARSTLHLCQIADLLKRNQAESLEPKGNSQRLNDFVVFNNTSNLTRFIRDI